MLDAGFCVKIICTFYAEKDRKQRGKIFYQRISRNVHTHTHMKTTKARLRDLLLSPGEASRKWMQLMTVFSPLLFKVNIFWVSSLFMLQASRIKSTAESTKQTSRMNVEEIMLPPPPPLLVLALHFYAKDTHGGVERSKFWSQIRMTIYLTSLVVVSP